MYDYSGPRVVCFNLNWKCSVLHNRRVNLFVMIILEDFQSVEQTNVNIDKV